MIEPIEVDAVFSDCTHVNPNEKIAVFGYKGDKYILDYKKIKEHKEKVTKWSKEIPDGDYEFYPEEFKEKLFVLIIALARLGMN